MDILCSLSGSITHIHSMSFSLPKLLPRRNASQISSSIGEVQLLNVLSLVCRVHW